MAQDIWQRSNLPGSNAYVGNIFRGWVGKYKGEQLIRESLEGVVDWDSAYARAKGVSADRQPGSGWKWEAKRISESATAGYRF